MGLLVGEDGEAYARELVSGKTERTGSEDVSLGSETSASQRFDI